MLPIDSKLTESFQILNWHIFVGLALSRLLYRVTDSNAINEKTHCVIAQVRLSFPSQRRHGEVSFITHFLSSPGQQDVFVSSLAKYH